MIKEGFIIIFCLLVVIARGDIVTTLLIDNFPSSGSSAVITSFQEDINSYNSKLSFEDTYYTGNRPATLCTYNNPTCTDQESAVIPGGHRYSGSSFYFYSYVPRGATDDISGSEQVEITASNFAWDASATLNNDGDATLQISYKMEVAYVNPCYAFAAGQSVDFLSGGGNYIAVYIEANENGLMGIHLEDIEGRGFDLYLEPYMYDSDIGQYVIPIDIYENIDYSQIAFFSIFSIWDQEFNPRSSHFFDMKITNVRMIFSDEIIEQSSGFTSGSSSSRSSQSSSSGSSQSSQSSRSSFSSLSSLTSFSSFSSQSSSQSSDSTIITPLFSLFLIILIACI